MLGKDPWTRIEGHQNLQKYLLVSKSVDTRLCYLYSSSIIWQKAGKSEKEFVEWGMKKYFNEQFFVKLYKIREINY